MDGWMDRWMGVWMDGWMDVWMDGRMDRMKDGRVDGRSQLGVTDDSALQTLLISAKRTGAYLNGSTVHFSKVY